MMTTEPTSLPARAITLAVLLDDYDAFRVAADHPDAPPALRVLTNLYRAAIRYYNTIEGGILVSALKTALDDAGVK